LLALFGLLIVPLCAIAAGAPSNRAATANVVIFRYISVPFLCTCRLTTPAKESRSSYLDDPPLKARDAAVTRVVASSA